MAAKKKKKKAAARGRTAKKAAAANVVVGSNAHVHGVLKAAVGRAKANKRGTVRPQDL